MILYFPVSTTREHPCRYYHIIMILSLSLEKPKKGITKKMENGRSAEAEQYCWNFRQDEGELERASAITVRGVLDMIMANLNQNDDGDQKPRIPLGHGDPSCFPRFRTPTVAEDAIVDALRSANFNRYSPTNGLPSARRAVAEYLSHDLPHSLSPDDVYLTLGCTQAIETTLTALARPGANILLPRPGFPYYESRAACCNLEARRFNLLPDQRWEIDLQSVEALSDANTVAMVIINPGNPCGSVYTRQHLEKIAEMARKLRILVIADEVYDRLTFGSTAFVPMGVFGSVVPVVTLGSISKRWSAPGWRLGWLVTNDPNGILRKTGLIKKIVGCLNVSSDPVTFIQGALPNILQNTKEDYFSKIIESLRETADICYNAIKEIPCITCPNKPEGSMFVMVKLNVSLLDDINDDLDFCLKLAKEESVVVLPGVTVGLKNWLRITFAVEPSVLEDGLGRIKAFCQKHAKN